MDTSQNTNKTSNFISNPKKNGTTFLIVAVVSLFVIPYMALSSIVMGSFGIYYSIKQKSGTSAIVLNSLAVVIGFISLVLKNLSSKLY